LLDLLCLGDVPPLAGMDPVHGVEQLSVLRNQRNHLPKGEGAPEPKAVAL